MQGHHEAQESINHSFRESRIISHSFSATFRSGGNFNLSAILSEAVQRRRKRGVEFPIDFGLHAPRSLVGPIHPCCSVRVLIVHRVPACLRCVGWMAGDSAAAAARVLTARRPPAPVRPFVVVGGGGGGLGSGASLHDQLKVASQAPSLPLSLSEASPAPVHRRRGVARGRGMDGRMGERTGGREGGSLMLQPFQKAADSLARSHARLAP